MTPSMTKKIVGGREQAARKWNYIPLLGATLLIVCLATGVAQAATPLENILIDSGLSIAKNNPCPGQVIQGAAEPNTCWEHIVDCYNGNQFIGTASAPCYFQWGSFTCEGTKDLDTCQAYFGGDIDKTVPITTCHYHQ
ncbi:hypothetical protein [Methanoregula sp.]|uniref:hypothetical protein n=1 Tax=Methanoregula sp. TaxID=2052170 RepID=UPI000CC41F7A|nr:hypothetical protein [Methanoregula sp.]PKG31951.1 MAG: hypothetical protein CW742_10710 [Methanoregula sp.]